MSKQSADHAVRILFIGNSYTSRNDMPKLLERIAADEADVVNLETQSIVAGGASLRRHWNAGVALKALRGSRWDFVVLQEQSTLPIKNPLRYKENVRLFHGEIACMGVATVLYQTWCRRDAPERQDMLTNTVAEIAAEVGAMVAAVGDAWRRALDTDPAVELYEADGSHPTLAGSMLAARTFYQTLVAPNVAGTTAAPDSLSEPR